MAKLKAGIIGTGQATGISKAHLLGYQECENVEFIGVYNHTRANAEKWCDAYGLDHALCYDSADALIADADLISICTPNYAHIEYVKKCLEANTHVLCEKPISTSCAEFAQLEQPLKTTSAIAMVGYNYRHIPGLRMIHDLVCSGKLGRIYTIRHCMGAPRLANEAVPMEWRFVRSLSGAGALTDFGSHALDILRYITGSDDLKLENLSARTATFIPERAGRDGTPQQVENDDAAMVLATVNGGTLYSLTLSRVGVASAWLELVAQYGIVRFDLMNPCQIDVQLRESGRPYGAKQTLVAEDANAWKQAGVPVPYKACAETVKEFVRLVETGEKPATDLYYGLQIQKDIEAIERIG